MHVASVKIKLLLSNVGRVVAMLLVQSSVGMTRQQTNYNLEAFA